ncbi:MAG: 3-hydroxyacyl-CoA dehydrogenase NAD-binding domain-containing protein, partial [Planctomycetota bacterium]
MQAAKIERALVIGAGTMGHGIAQVLAQAGIATTLADVSQETLDRARATVEKNLAKGVDKGKVSAEERDAALSRLSTSTDTAAAADGVQCVVEAVPEKLDLKMAILRPLGEQLGPEVLIASNTSSLSLTELAASIPHPERVTGMHFFNPVHIMKLVEVVRADQSSDAAV